MRPARKQVSLAFALAILFPGVSHPADGQRVYRIGALVSADEFVPAFDGFKKKMIEFGYKEGKNVVYELHNAKGDSAALARLAKQLIQDRPDLVVTTSSSSTLPVAQASAGTAIPVVFLSAGEPLRFAKSYGSSGNNLTGISTAVVDLTEKRLELLKELAPWVKRVALLANPLAATYNRHLVAMKKGCKKLQLQVLEKNASNREEIAKVAPSLNRKTIDAIVMQPDMTLGGHIDLVDDQAIREKLPLIPPPAFIKRGGLATYGPDNAALGSQGAVLVDKIFKGARPADLPIEQPAKLNLVINLRTARAIGFKIPKDVLLRADQIIE
ncbi:MAG TPA: ABC transporter substrate-binding protein [Methylomirabilota bacterium]|nr:ABC transporter substrate-binding protein [Methylomirabilota bacterium]